MFTSAICLLQGNQYNFFILDSGGDGLGTQCTDDNLGDCMIELGGFTVRYGDFVLFTGGDFESEEVIAFTVPIPLPPTTSPNTSPTNSQSMSPSMSPSMSKTNSQTVTDAPSQTRTDSSA